LELRNTHDTKMQQYSSWSRAPGVSLTDNFENHYALRSTKLKSEAIYPGNSVEEMLVFRKPVQKAKYLRLELPAISFGAEGMIRFQIPVSMIRDVEEIAIDSKAKRPPLRPRTPAAKQGEGGEAEPPPIDTEPGETPAQREEPTISRSIEEMDRDLSKAAGASPEPSEKPAEGGNQPAPSRPKASEGGIPGVDAGGDRVKPPPKKDEDPDGMVDQLNQDIDAMGGGDKSEKVDDFQSDPKRMKEFEEMRRQQRAQQDAERKANKKPRGK
jgi:hypothetical protein